MCDDEYNHVGRIKLRELYGAVDAAYAQMSSSSDYSNVIYGSPYTLNNTEYYYGVFTCAAKVINCFHLLRY